MWKKIVGYGLLSVVMLAGSVFAYLYFRKPASRPPADIKVAMTPERVARGEYLFKLGDCDNCHSKHDTKNFALIDDSGRGMGNMIPEGKLKLVIPNITPDKETGIGDWTDGEKIRAIREGIGRDGRALFPMMPYQNFRHMSDDDVQSLVAYLNSLPPVRNPLPRMEVPFPISLFIKGMPQPVLQPVANPNPASPRARAEYLVTIGGCQTCHTGDDKSKKFAGGHEFKIGPMRVVSANITPDADTGIGTWSRQYFKQRFRNYRDKAPERFTVMPWMRLAQLTDEDLDLIYDYLRTQAPVENKVNTQPLQLAQAK